MQPRSGILQFLEQVQIHLAGTEADADISVSFRVSPILLWGLTGAPRGDHHDIRTFCPEHHHAHSRCRGLLGTERARKQSRQQEQYQPHECWLSGHQQTRTHQAAPRHTNLIDYLLSLNRSVLFRDLNRSILQQRTSP